MTLVIVVKTFIIFCHALYVCMMYWVIVLFQERKNATEMQKKFCAVYREGAVTNGTCQKWCAKFPDTVDILAK